MEKLNLRKNPGDILYAADVSSIVSTINNIITYITSENGSGSGSGSGGSVGDVVDIPSPIITWGNRIPTPWTEDGYNEFGLPWGIWLLSYLTSDLENPIHERLLYESEYALYLGSGYEITTNVSITYKNELFRDELFNEPMLVSLYPSGSTDFSNATLNKDWYKITGVPRMWEVLVDVTNVDSSNTYGVQPYYTDYRQFIEPSEVIYHLDWHNTLYNKAVSMGSSDDANPIVGFTGTVTMTTGSNNTTTVTESVSLPINPARDLSLDHLFVIIPKEIFTWEQFVANPESCLQTIKANEKNATITAARILYENDIKEVLKDTIIREGTDRFGLDFGTEANPTSYRNSIANYLNTWLELCGRLGIEMRSRAKDIVIGWFKKYDPSHVHVIYEIDGVKRDYGIEQDPGIIWSDFDGIWDSSATDDQGNPAPRYTGENGYRYTSVKHMRDIPRFDKLYCLDDIATSYSDGGPTIFKGPIQDMNYCPRYENNDKSLDNAIDGSWEANIGDIVVELISTSRENHHTIDYYVMHGDEHNMHTEQLFPEQMFDIANALEYLTSSSGADRFYNNHPNATRRALGVSVSLPYENVVDISTGNIENNTVITDKWNSLQASGKYFRYGGDYAVFAFRVEKKFYIKDIKWGFSETLDLGRG